MLAEVKHYIIILILLERSSENKYLALEELLIQYPDHALYTNNMRPRYVHS